MRRGIHEKNSATRPPYPPWIGSLPSILLRLAHYKTEPVRASKHSESSSALRAPDLGLLSSSRAAERKNRQGQEDPQGHRPFFPHRCFLPFTVKVHSHPPPTKSPAVNVPVNLRAYFHPDDFPEVCSEGHPQGLAVSVQESPRRLECTS